VARHLTHIHLALVLLMLAPHCFAATEAQDHVVGPAELQQALQAKMQKRQLDSAKLERFFSQPPIQEAMKAGGIDYAKVQQAIPQLTDDELASISKRAEQIQRDFEAGFLGIGSLTLLLLLLIALIIIIVAVKA